MSARPLRERLAATRAVHFRIAQLADVSPRFIKDLAAGRTKRLSRAYAEAVMIGIERAEAELADMPAPTFDVRMAVEIGHVDGLLERVLSRYREAQEAGELPGDADRKPPAADHAIVWCVDAQGLVGFATFYDVDLGRLWLDVLWVDPRYRRRGIGKALLAAIRERSSASYRIMLGTRVDNAAMRRLAESFGARQTVAHYEIAPRELSR